MVTETKWDHAITPNAPRLPWAGIRAAEPGTVEPIAVHHDGHRGRVYV